jgi:hypothetical protein
MDILKVKLFFLVFFRNWYNICQIPHDIILANNVYWYEQTGPLRDVIHLGKSEMNSSSSQHLRAGPVY